MTNLQQDETTNPILQYWEQMKNGDLVVCQKIYKTYKKLAQDVKRTNGTWYYSEKRANHIITFFEKYLRHSKGKLGGKKVKLELWEKALFAAAYGFIDINGNRKYHRVVLIVGKKNGKSFIASGVGLYGLIADGEPGPEIYSVATKRDQAKIIWDESRKMRNKAPALKKRITATISELRCDDNDGTFKPLASDVNSLDGLNVYYALMDEFQQWRNGKALYDIIADGVSARDDPMIFMTSTAGTVREDIYDTIYDECEMIVNGYDDPEGYKDERTLVVIYELDSKSEYTNPDAWMKANPNLGVSKSYSYLEEKVKRAILNPANVKNLVCKEFNIRETAGDAWLSFDDIDNRGKFDTKELKPKYGIGGFDLSQTTDLTAAVVIFMLPGGSELYVIPMFWLPSYEVERHVREDKIPYDDWIKQKYIRTCEGNKINYKDIKEWFIEIQNEYDIYLPWIGYDSWSATYLVNDMQDYFGKQALEPVIQGKKTLSSPMLDLGADFRAHRVIYNNNPVLKWCLTNVSVDTDINGNIQPIKGNNARQRIDGFAALLDAKVALSRHMEEYLSII